jgi:hypothetical protein
LYSLLARMTVDWIGVSLLLMSLRLFLSKSIRSTTIIRGNWTDLKLTMFSIRANLPQFSQRTQVTNSIILNPRITRAYYITSSIVSYEWSLKSDFYSLVRRISRPIIKERENSKIVNITNKIMIKLACNGLAVWIPIDIGQNEYSSPF